MNRRLFLDVQDRAGGRCEYCHLPQSAFPLPFQPDHIRAEKHRGETIEGNLALACTHSNRHQGPKIAGYDAQTGRIVRLFNPRTDRWEQHFEASGPRFVGKTAIGRATVDVLEMNDTGQLIVRRALLSEDTSVR